MKFRLYIDEVGNHDLGSSSDPNNRYLSLTGIIIELDYVKSVLHPQMEALKERYFNSHPDEPVILHRKELASRLYPFHVLRKADVEAAFNEEVMQLFHTWEYEVITVTIDKLELVNRYTVWRYDPYHYCLKVLIERYVQCLARKETVGDVIAESRGGREDRRLKASFERVYEEGSEYVLPEVMQERLTSKQLKVKPKANNISGLQLADLLAHPSYKAALARKKKDKLAQNFGGRIAQILEEHKYYRSDDGKIEGWGRKWLP